MEIEEPVQTNVATHRISYAQNMEDILLDRLFGGQAGTFMDIGANHPFIDSNTYFFYLRGWRGVNLEPTRRGHELFLKYRPDDLNLNVAASDVEGELPFYEIANEQGLTGLSTLSSDVAEHHRTEGFQVFEDRVPVRTIAALVEEHGIAAPDLLSIDVESHEGHVIRGLPLSTWRPRVLVIESTQPLTESASHQDWEPILLAHGYLFAAFNGVNRFYLRDDLRDRLDCFQTPVNVLDVYQRHETIVFRHLYEKTRDELGSERFHFEQERGGWAWGQSQARHAQACWEQERAAFEEQRGAWKDALDFFERSKADWARERESFAHDRGAWEQARACHERERAGWADERAEWAAERTQWAAEQARWADERARWADERVEWERQRSAFARAEAEWQREREHYLQQIASTQGALRPYRLIDRMGVVGAGYGWARRIKRKLVS
jgi:FkbM family methyltransferase